MPQKQPGPVSPPDHTCSSSSPHSRPLPGSAGGGGGPPGSLRPGARRQGRGEEGLRVERRVHRSWRAKHSCPAAMTRLEEPPAPGGGGVEGWPPTHPWLPTAPSGPQETPPPTGQQSPDTLKRLPAPSQQTQPGRRGLRFWFRAAEAERPKASV